MYLVFANKEITRDIQLIDEFLPHNEDSEPNYEDAEWGDIEADVLLGGYETEYPEDALKNAAKKFCTDIAYLYAVKVEEFKPIYISDCKNTK